MKIVVEVKSFYDWVPIEGKPDDDAVIARDATGKLVQLKHIKRASETTIDIPEQQVDATFENFSTDPVPFTRLKKEHTPTQERDYPQTWLGALAWHVGEKIMPMHAPSKDWGKIAVDKDKKAQRELNKIFGGSK